MKHGRTVERFDLELPMLIKGVDVKGKSFEEFTKSLNISSGGAYFLIRSQARRADSLHTTISLPRKIRNQVSLDGTIVRVEHLNNNESEKQGIALQFNSNNTLMV
tara:strand:- start:259 stop:573 length:315 start_codon:yes stop_codon:yes gene_type:complete